MRENRPSGSEAGVALIPPSLPLSSLTLIARPAAKACSQTQPLPPRAAVWPGLQFRL